MALPVRSELIAQVQTLGGRLTRRLTATLEKRKLELRSASGRMPRLDALLQAPRQRLDLASQRFGGSLSRMVARKRAKFDAAGGGLRPAALRREIVGKRAEVERLAARLQPALGRRMKRLRDALREQTRVLDSVSYERVLARGFALVTNGEGGLVRLAAAVAEGDALKLRFADGEVGVTAGGRSGGPKAPNAGLAAPDVQRPSIRRRTTGGDQGSLF